MGVLQLTIQPGGEGTATEVCFDQEQVMLGRSSYCDVRLPLPIISSHHLTFLREGDGFTVMDAGSTNGTFLGDVRLVAHEAVEIRSGDELRVLDLTMQVEILGMASETFTLAESTMLLSKLMDAALVENETAGEGLALEVEGEAEIEEVEEVAEVAEVEIEGVGDTDEVGDLQGALEDPRVETMKIVGLEDKKQTKTPPGKPLRLVEVGFIVVSCLLIVVGAVLFLYVLEVF